MTLLCYYSSRLQETRDDTTLKTCCGYRVLDEDGTKKRNEDFEFVIMIFYFARLLVLIKETNNEI